MPSGTYLNVSTSAIDFLLVLDGKLDNKVFVLVGELVESGGEGVELGVLRGLEPLHFVPAARLEREFSVVILVFGLEPTLFPPVLKISLFSVGETFKMSPNSVTI